MRSCSFVLAVLLVLGAAGTSSASLIVENSPATETSFRIGGSNTQVEAVIWLQSAASNDVQVSALVGSVDGNSRTVNAYLEQNSVGNVIASTTVTVGSFTSSADFTLTTIFTGLDLSPSFYRLTLFNTDSTGDVNVRWGVAGGTTNTDYGFFAGSQFANGSDADVSFPFLSNFTTSTAPLGFQVTGVVPEPSSFVMGLIAMATVVVIGGRARVRRQAA
ncbi:MAG: hypothetical protein JSS02_34975 [Planctomycetes bacterium]|nr:hypothetical protein [Planctomycetota bacterium]